MDRKDFIEKFAEVLEIEEISELQESTEFRSLEEWDSLVYLNIISMLEEEYDVQIENVAFKRLRTLGDIIDYVENS